MNILAFLDLGADLEAHVSKLYEALASLSANAVHAKTLKSLAGDELNHAIILRTGKRYYEEMPDLFAGTKMSPGEVYAATEKVKAAMLLGIWSRSIRSSSASATTKSVISTMPETPSPVGITAGRIGKPQA